MKKIPTIFKRDEKGRITREPHPAAGWVFAGEGVATRKYDGTCMMIRGGEPFKRREVRPGQVLPSGFEAVGTDPATGKTVGWVPLGYGPEDRYHREAFASAIAAGADDGCYELCGPKIQGNPEGFESHILVALEGAQQVPDVPRDFEGLATFLPSLPYEGIVWHHPDGRMAKIKRRDFERLRP